MNLLSVFFIGIGLSMDAFAVSVAKGMCIKRDLWKTALKLGFWFGLFQAVMPFIGWFAGTYFQSMIESVDHWIAFLMLGFIGINMIRESLKGEDDDRNSDICTRHVLVLAVATSIDALAVGISFAFLQVEILPAVLIIGCTTFILSILAVYIGNKLGGAMEKYAGIIGGMILILIGFKILMEHLFLS